MRDAGGLDDRYLALLVPLQAACPAAAAAYPLLQEIVRIVRAQPHERLDAWLAAAVGSSLPDVASFADGLRRERTDLLAALTLPWSTGQVEGHITRLKLIKRRGYGRAGLATLKRRYLRAACARKRRKSHRTGARPVTGSLGPSLYPLKGWSLRAP